MDVKIQASRKHMEKIWNKKFVLLFITNLLMMATFYASVPILPIYCQENGITGRKPYLTQYLGIDPDEMMIEPYIKSYYLQEGDTFLICSDGVTDMVEEQEICRILAHNEDVGDCVDLLIQAALDGGGKDNITAIVVRME